MSLYHQLFGVYPGAPVILAYLRFDPGELPRLRDAFLSEDGTELLIYTRAGGPNREQYKNLIDGMRSHILYIRDEDDPTDETYGIFYYRIPENDEKGRALFDRMFKELGGVNPPKRWKEFLSGMTDSNNPAHKVAQEVAMKVLGPILNSVVAGDVKVTMVSIGPEGVEVHGPEGKIIGTKESHASCPTCGTLNDRITGPSNIQPVPGSISICNSCLELAIFNEELKLEKLSPEKMQEIEASEQWLTIQEARRAILAMKQPKGSA